MRFILCLLLIMFFTVSVGLAQDDSVVWVTVKESQLMDWATTILRLKSKVSEFSANITALQMEIMRVQSESLGWEKKYKDARKGWWVGVSSGYPLGGQGMAMYQINERFGLFFIGGYSSVWMVNAGFIARIK